MKLKINQYIAICLLLVIANAAKAQNARFATQGVIEFEKRVNMYALIKAEIKKYPNSSYYPRMFEEFQKTNTQFKSLKSTLTFSKDQTLFKPEEAVLAQNNYFGDYPAAQQNNTIFTNTAIGTSISQKKVYEETYLVKDSTRKINWKITNETRNIAGYDCRRANAIIMDSIYVVAFYTDEIPVSGGPESFSGLPGMILGVALPYEHTTWFATNVNDQSVTEDKLKAPVKGKATTNAGLIATLQAALKDWGDYAKDAFKAFLL
ncbi:GLPGLI family protein [Pedobacter boryungensis]|uniref:GLPGLI family protein n=1 Tax=Pedobacter boryungensis TaxID=869962 RepID=A0ABX2DF92_9SPHI|nr:GLPGLI family protein [Pedobacter boryungensis]NQX31819.1 GLPGLI family protein [Pedobacter boryungensis]